MSFGAEPPLGAGGADGQLERRLGGDLERAVARQVDRPGLAGKGFARSPMVQVWPSDTTVQRPPSGTSATSSGPVSRDHRSPAASFITVSPVNSQPARATSTSMSAPELPPRSFDFRSRHVRRCDGHAGTPLRG